MSLMPAGLLVAMASAAIAGLLVFRMRASGGLFYGIIELAAGRWVMPAMVFTLVAATGVATSYQRGSSPAHGSRDTPPAFLSRAGADDEALARLKDYAASTGAKEPIAAAATDRLLPDVDTMIEQLAARLKAKPEDVQGWQMLGWSYFHTARYEQAAAAYANAIKIDPDSAELKLAFDQAKAKAAKSNSDDEGSGAAVAAASEAIAPHVREAEIRSMVEGLATRLEGSPRNVEAWTRLMRARMVLGEREAAALSFRKALDIFKDDSVASGRLGAVAKELNLEAQ